MIRKANIYDVEIISDFNSNIAIETESLALNHSVLLLGVQALLEDPQKGTYYLCERDGRIVGQMLITFEWSDWRNGWIWWIQSVYVAKEFRRKGVFRELHQHVIKEAKAQGDVKGLRLYVEKENKTAMKTYENIGMVCDRYAMYEKIFSGS